MPGLAGRQHGGDGVVDAEELVILSEDFHNAGLVLRKQREVFHEVEQPVLVAGSANHDFQGHPAGFVLAFNALPLEEPIPICSDRAHMTVGAV
jgi:hypothetical protein